MMDTDREKHPLMKDLHELGLKHGVAMTVVAVKLKGEPATQAFWIDHRDDTSPAEAAYAFESTGVFLIKVAAKIAEEEAAEG
jgi:hypothetical protein